MSRDPSGADYTPEELAAAEKLDRILDADPVDCPDCDWRGGRALLQDHRNMAH